MSDPAEPTPLVETTPEPFPLVLLVDAESAGQRLDAFLAARLADVAGGFSRTLLRRAIDGGNVTVDGAVERAAQRLAVGMSVRVERLQTPPPGPKPQAIPLSILYEDDDLVAVNKPPGMVVHPAKGHWEGTLASALAHHFGDALSKTGGPTRPGIVHRLDRDTSGVLVVAKHDRAHDRLAEQFHDRTVQKTYLAIVLGSPDRDADVIDKPIGPHPHHRERMAVREDHPESRSAVTRFEVVERFGRFTLIRAAPKTGRTHQIRVHLAHAGWPVLCDKVYGGRSRITSGELRGGLPQEGAPALLARQALHAHQLQIDQPTSGLRLSFEAPLPADIAAVLSCLRGVR